jgi:hypothetical protein
MRHESSEKAGAFTGKTLISFGKRPNIKRRGEKNVFK